MQRLTTCFAVFAAIMLAFGTVVARVVPNTGMTYTWTKGSYLIPNQVLCYGVGFALAFFALLYSAWLVPWNSRVATWHLALSSVVASSFFTCLVARDRLSRGKPDTSVAVSVALILSPILFAGIQIGFGLDALRRCLLVFGHR